MMRTLTLAQADRIRAQPHRAVLLYLTDRCPVGCAHCSVSALPRGPGPDSSGGPALVERLVDELCAMTHIRLVGISGGEPFMERRVLSAVTAKLETAGKQMVLYTSGNWGRDDGTAPGWTRAVLARASCVVLSTDSYHAAHIPEARYLAALRAAASAGSWVAVQVLGTPAQTAEAERLLTAAFGTSWPQRAEIRSTALLPHGRADPSSPASRLRPDPPAGQGTRPGRPSAPCRLALAPVVRYDGRITACCNEDVVTGHGPAALQASAREPGELRASLLSMRRDPFLRAITGAGPGALTLLPRYRAVGEQGHRDICSLCWTLLEHGADRDPAVQAIGLLSRRPGGSPGPRRSP
jgi:hypothetical protein